MNLYLNSIFQAVKSDFCALVDCRLRGDTIEILTSIPTITSSYVSVFVSHNSQTGRFAISDGGWVARNYYESPEVEDNELIKRIFLQYKEHFQIEQTASVDKTPYYYKTTDKLELVSAMVFDVGHFVSSVVNAQSIAYKESDELDKTLFHNRLNGFLKNKFGQEKVELNKKVKINETENIRFNAVLHANAFDHYYLMYVTGSRKSFFIKDLTEATVNYEIVNDSAVKPEYFKKMAIINTAAAGYDRQKSGVYIERLSKAIGHEPIFVSSENDSYKLAEAISLN